MSNVTPREIIDLVAEEFGVLVIEMIGRWAGQNSAGSAGLQARDTAVYLIRRHTRTGPTEIGRLLAIPSARGPIIAGLADNTLRAMRQPDMLFRIRRIEDRIDALHEARIAAQLELAGAGE